MDKLLFTRLSLDGGGDNLSFFFLYELLTGSLRMSITPGDSAYNWGAILIRLLPAGVWG